MDSQVKRQSHDADIRKGAYENGKTPVSMTGQLGHRTEDELLKESDSDFPEPGGNPEHSGEPEAKK